MRKQKVLIVDDDPSILRFVRANISASGYETLVAGDGKAALEVIEVNQPDLVLLDIMMPNMDGLEVCRRLREWSQIPIIMLTARGDEKDKVECLDMGADDYIAKPFGVDELLARVRAVLRRSQTSTGETPSQSSFKYDDLVINYIEHKVTLGEQEIRLTRTEYNLLQELTLNAGKVLTHKHLLYRIWGPEYQDEREYLHVFMNRLRTKLGKGAECIVTIPGVGYEIKRPE